MNAAVVLTRTSLIKLAWLNFNMWNIHRLKRLVE